MGRLQGVTILQHILATVGSGCYQEVEWGPGENKQWENWSGPDSVLTKLSPFPLGKTPDLHPSGRD